MESKTSSLPQQCLTLCFTLFVFKFRNDVIRRVHSLTQFSSHLQTPFTGAHRSRGFSHWLLALMSQTVVDMERLARLLERNGQSALGAGLKQRFAKSSGSAGSGGSATKGGLAAGTAPDRFGADRNSAPVEEIDADDLYKVFDPVGLQKKWSVSEVARVVTALPDMHLPWKKGSPSSSMEALDEAVFKAGITDSTTALVDADVAAGNCAFGGSGDCENTLDYHLWALALLLNTRYKVRAVHLNNAFDVTSLYKLRKLGYSQKPSRGSTKATEMRWAQVIFLKKVHVAEILSALGLVDEAKAAVGPTGEGWSSAMKAEQCLADGSAAASAFWAAIGTGPDKNDRVTAACFDVVRVLAGGASGSGSGGAGASTKPPPAPPPPPATTADGMYGLMFGFLAGDALVQAKGMALQVIFPGNRRYENAGLVQAGAFDSVLKSWIGSHLEVLARSVIGAPINDMGGMLQLVVDVVDTDAVTSAGDSGSGTGGGSRGGGGGGKSSTDDLIKAIDGTRLPSVKGEDGHERLVALPGGMLPLVQAESLVAKYDVLEQAVALGNTPAGALACANLGVMKEERNPDTGKLENVKVADAELNWAMSQSIPATASTGASDRARTTKLLHSAQTIVIDNVTSMIKAASDGGESAGCFTPSPSMVSDMLKGMIFGSRPHVVRSTTTLKRHDYGPWMCVPMNVPNRPTSTMLFFEWYYAVGSYSNSPRQMMVAEDALSNWCKVMDALGQVYMNEFRNDCAAYIVKHNKRFQLRLNEQQFFDLFLGGIMKLDKLNMAWQSSSSPSRKPRLKGVFSGGSMVSDTFNELIEFGLRKLTRDLEDRGQTIFGEIPILFACTENASSSPAPGGGGFGGAGGQLDMRLPPSPAHLTQGTLLQLGGAGGGGGWPRSALTSTGQYGQQNETSASREAAFKLDGSNVRASQRADLPPGPRKAGILPAGELLPGAEIKSRNVVFLFKSEPLLNGQCAALLVKDEGCTWEKCPYCPKTLSELPRMDAADLKAALRRCMGSSGARPSRPGTPRRDRSDSVGSDRSAGSQRSDGGGWRSKHHRS